MEVITQTEISPTQALGKTEEEVITVFPQNISYYDKW